MTAFHDKRRQQFLGEAYYLKCAKDIEDALRMFSAAPAGSGDSELEGWMISRSRIAANRFEGVSLRYTAGEPIAPLRRDLELVVSAFEKYGEDLWKYRDDRNEPVFTFTSLDDYCQLMQLIGLCYLLHRRDLLPRLAALQDGENRANGGVDWVYEELMSYAPMQRHETEHMCATKPYEALADALSSDDNAAGLRDLNRFLKRWYKDLGGAGWHGSHKPDEGGNQGGYYGYWSFEAGAAVLLLGIEDDSSLHQYLYYPKDLVAWSREHAALSDAGDKTTIRLRAMAGEACPKEGYWFTPARPNSRRRFHAGEPMPDTGGDYGATIWQWDERQ